MLRAAGKGIPYVTATSKEQNLPAPGTMSARIDVKARLRVFDVDGSLLRSSREAWILLEPEIHAISEAYWQQWLRCFADERNWAPDDTGKMIEVGVVFLKNRFLDTAGSAWIESIERSVAAAYADDVPPMALLSMISASDRAALDVLIHRSGVGRSAAPSADRHADAALGARGRHHRRTLQHVSRAYRSGGARPARARIPRRDRRDGRARFGGG